MEKIINSEKVVISIQVLNELSNVFLRKFKLSGKKVSEIIDEVNYNIQVKNIYFETIRNAIIIKEKYKYSYYDSLIISTALENECKILYSEDLQSGQLIENRLLIKNPLI